MCTITLRLGLIGKKNVQGYSQRMRLQRRLYGIFLHSRFLLDKNWLISVLIHLVNHKKTQFNVETQKQASNRHIF